MKLSLFLIVERHTARTYDFGPEWIHKPPVPPEAMFVLRT